MGVWDRVIFDFPTFIQMPLTPTSVLVFGLQEACTRQDLKWNQASFSFPPGLFNNCRARSKCSPRLRLNSPLQFLVVAGKVPSCTHENSREVRRMGNRHRRTAAKDCGASLLHPTSFQSYEGQTLHLSEAAQPLNIGHPRKAAWAYPPRTWQHLSFAAWLVEERQEKGNRLIALIFYIAYIIPRSQVLLKWSLMKVHH